jgi:transcriptional regulator with XRE-family HTH domain
MSGTLPVARKYLAGIERSLRNPALENLVKLANALDVTMAELFSPERPAGGPTGRQESTDKTKRTKPT